MLIMGGKLDYGVFGLLATYFIITLAFDRMLDIIASRKTS
jgi:hypothetical protein